MSASGGPESWGGPLPGGYRGLWERSDLSHTPTFWRAVPPCAHCYSTKPQTEAVPWLLLSSKLDSGAPGDFSWGHSPGEEDREEVPPDLAQPCHTPSAHRGLGNPTCSDQEGHIWGSRGEGGYPRTRRWQSNLPVSCTLGRGSYFGQEKQIIRARACAAIALSLPPPLALLPRKHTFSMTFFHEIFDNIAAQEFRALVPGEIFGSFLAFAAREAQRPLSDVQRRAPPGPGLSLPASRRGSRCSI